MAVAHPNRCRARGLWVATLAASLLGCTTMADASSPRQDRRPNIILIVSDDQPASTLTPALMPRTIAELAERGVWFNNYTVATAQCCPSRAAGLTGQYPHNNGVLSNRPGYTALQQKRNILPVWLKSAGYRTVHVGRYLNGYSTSRVAAGWDQWHTVLATSYYRHVISHNGNRVVAGEADDDYVTRVLSRISNRMVSRFVPRRKPLFMQIDHLAPHVGAGRGDGSCAGGAIPDPVDAHRFDEVPLPAGPGFDEEDVEDKPSFIARQQLMSDGVVAEVTRLYRCAIGSLPAIDRALGELLDELRSARELANTAIIYVTDNGYQYGEHRIAVGKGFPYEESINFPLLFRAPVGRQFRGTRGIESDAVVANIDLAPSILALARADPCRAKKHCRRLDGRSLIGLLRGRDPDWSGSRAIRTNFQINLPSYGYSCEFDGLRSARYTYVRHSVIPLPGSNQCVSGEEIEAYDRFSDPFQLHADALEPTELDGLAAQLERLEDCTGIRGRDPRPPRGRSYCE